MKYVGSKGRHAKQILPIILKDRRPGQAYVEPFVGGANTIQHVGGQRIAGDTHANLASMWSAVSGGWLPDYDKCGEGDYAKAKSLAKGGAIDPQLGFIGFALSFGGKWFGGYARGVKPDGTPRDFVAEAARHCNTQFPKLRGVEFHNCSYDELPIPDGSIIYCDPPYAGTLGYSTGDFDHERFWQWVRDKSAEGHNIFVSEYRAPDDFKCVWEKPVNNTLVKDTGAKKAVERLFVPSGQ